jgi:hypothetical protein
MNRESRAVGYTMDVLLPFMNQSCFGYTCDGRIVAVLHSAGVDSKTPKGADICVAGRTRAETYSISLTFSTLR